MVHGLLLLVTVTGQWFGKTPCVQICTTQALTCPRTVKWRPCQVFPVPVWQCRVYSDTRINWVQLVPQTLTTHVHVNIQFMTWPDVMQVENTSALLRITTLCPEKKWTPKYIAIIQRKRVRFVWNFTHANLETCQWKCTYQFTKT